MRPYQSKKESFEEVCFNMFVGYVVAVAATFAIFPLVGLESDGRNFIVAAFFTVVSIIRSYMLRRFYEAGGFRRWRKNK